MFDLLSIKLNQPAPPLRRVRRPALRMRLQEGLEVGRPVALISAPAGSGKTTCASEWLAEANLPVAWLALDEEDNDPGRFFIYLVEAMINAAGRGSFPRMREVEGVLRSGQIPPPEEIASALIADLCELPRRDAVRPGLVLVLDDFHLVQERLILWVFEKLITRLFLPNLPQPLHLVLLTREDPGLPLARLRAANRLTEVRANDLRFSVEETGRFLGEVLDLTLDPEDITELNERTEGWVVGLQLAGLSLRGLDDPTRLIAGLSGNHRFILGYLTEEVLNRQPEEVQSFLLSTSILDRLTGDLCDAVWSGKTATGSLGGHFMLEQLWKANLFLVPLDEEMRWYRYHHLFAGLLRRRQEMLHPEETANLHRRASQWLAETCESSPPGELAAMASAAVRHALAAGESATAVKLIETHAQELLSQWYAKTVSGWVQMLPPEWSARSPRVNLAFARAHLMRGEISLAAPYLDRLQSIFSTLKPDESGSYSSDVRPEWLALQSTLLGMQGRLKEALALAQEAQFALESGVEKGKIANDIAHSHVLIALANAYQQLEDFTNAESVYLDIIRLGQESGNISIELTGLSAFSLQAIESGQIRLGYDLAQQAAERVEKSGALPPICAGIYGELGQISYHWNRLDEASRYLERAARVSALVGFSDAGIFLAVFRSRLAQIRGDLNTAAREIQNAVQLMRVDAPVVVREEAVAGQVRIALAQGNLAVAEMVLSQEASHLEKPSLFELPPGQVIAYHQGVLFNAALRTLVFRSAVVGEGAASTYPDPAGRAFALAGHLVEIYLERRYISLAIETLLLRARLNAAFGNKPGSLADVSAALDLAEPEGYISDFVIEGAPVADALSVLAQKEAPGSERISFIRDILGAFPVMPVSLGQVESMVESLTARELEVLRLIATGKTYAEIAGVLVVSINTVRTHVKAIYSKLGENNRSGAVEAARRQKLLN